MERDIQIIVKKVKDGKLDFVEATKQILLLFSVIERSEQVRLTDIYKLARNYTESDFIQMVKHIQG